MQLEIDPKTFLEALLGSDLETAHVLVLDAYRAATKALLADRDRYFSVLHAIDPETFGTVTGRTKTEFEPVYHTTPLESTGRTSIEQQLANNPPSAGLTKDHESFDDRAAKFRQEVEAWPAWKQAAAGGVLADLRVTQTSEAEDTCPLGEETLPKPTPEAWHQVRSIHQARMFVGQTVAVSYEPPSPHDDGDTHVHTYVADIVDQGGGTWSLVDTLDNVIASGGPSDQTATVYLRPWGKGYGWTDVDVCGGISRERGPLRACRFDVNLDAFDGGTQVPVQVGMNYSSVLRERIYTDLETALEATRASDESEEPVDVADDEPEWKGWARLYTIDDAREWIGRKVHVSVGPPDLDDLGPVHEIADVRKYPEIEGGWDLISTEGEEICFGSPRDVDQECWVIHLLEVADRPSENLWAGVDPSGEDVADVWVAPLRNKGSAIVDPSTWKPEPTEDTPKAPTLDKPKPGMWHKVTTREEAERFVGSRVARLYQREKPPLSPSWLGACQENVHRVVGLPDGAWRMHNSKGNTICAGRDSEDPLHVFVWAFE